MTTDAPLIAYANLLSGSNIAVRRGSLDAASGLDRLYDSDLLRPAFFNSGIVGLTALSTLVSAWRSVMLGVPLTAGKWYWEVTVGAAASVYAGAGTAAELLTSYVGGTAAGYGYYSANGQKYTAGAGAAYGATYTTGDVIGVALDMTAGTLTFYKNGVSQGVAYTGLSGTLYPMFSVQSTTAGSATIKTLYDDFTYPLAGYAAPGDFTSYTSDASLTMTENRILELGIYPTSPINCIILGAARTDSAGQITGATGVTAKAYTSASGYGQGGYGQGGYGGYSLSSSTTFSLTSATSSRIAKFSASCSLLVLTFTGCSAKVSIPELFVGNALEMPFLEYGYDPYNEIGSVSLFTAESGREYGRLRYRRMELNPVWKNVPQASWAAVDDFRDSAVEPRAPFWFAWQPDTSPMAVYLVRHVDSSAPFPIDTARTRSFALKLQEVL